MLVAVSQAGLLPEQRYSSAAAVSSQSIVRHDQPNFLAAAPVAKLAVAAPVAYQAAPIAYRAAPAPVTYHAAPVAKVVAQQVEEIVSNHNSSQHWIRILFKCNFLW